MLLQTLSTIVILLLLVGGLLTSSLLSAKIAFHRAITRQVQVTLARGTDDFTRWAADYVYKNHADAKWPATWQSLSPQTLCLSQQDSSQGQGTCNLAQTTSYRVTGSTAAAIANGGVGQAQDVAENLQTAVNEQRIAAEVTSTITNSNGVVVGSGTRELTVRVFDVPPWAVVTGARDLSSVLGSERAVEGDTGGYRPQTLAAESQNAPDASNPSSFRDTVIEVKMTCNNSAANGDEFRPHADNHAPGNNSMPWGVQAAAGAFEAPCIPTYQLDSNHAPPTNTKVPADGNYDVGALAAPRTWKNGTTETQSVWSK